MNDDGGSALRSEIWGSLKAKHALATVEAAIESNFTEASTSAAVRRALLDDGARLDRLDTDGDLGKAVVAGTLTHEKWVNIARLTWDDVAAQLRVMGESMPSWDRLWNEVVLPTAREVKKAAEDAAAATPYVLVLAVLALVAIAILKVA